MQENPFFLPTNREIKIINSSVFIIYPLGLKAMSIIYPESSQKIFLADRRRVFTFNTSQLDALLADETQDRTAYINWIAGSVGRRIFPDAAIGLNFKYPYVCLPRPPLGIFFEDDPDWQLIEKQIQYEIPYNQLKLMKSYFGSEESKWIAIID